MVEKLRPRPNVAIARRLHGDVRGKDVLVVDDIIDTGGTIAEAVRLIVQHGSGRIQIAATHGIFSGDARVPPLRPPPGGVERCMDEREARRVVGDGRAVRERCTDRGRSMGRSGSSVMRSSSHGCKTSGTGESTAH